MSGNLQDFNNLQEYINDDTFQYENNANIGNSSILEASLHVNNRKSTDFNKLDEASNYSSFNDTMYNMEQNIPVGFDYSINFANNKIIEHSVSYNSNAKNIIKAETTKTLIPFGSFFKGALQIYQETISPTLEETPTLFPKNIYDEIEAMPQIPQEHFVQKEYKVDICANHKTSLYVELDPVSDKNLTNNNVNINIEPSETNYTNDILTHRNFCNSYKFSDPEFISEMKAKLRDNTDNDCKNIADFVQEVHNIDNKKSVYIELDPVSDRNNINSYIDINIHTSEINNRSDFDFISKSDAESDGVIVNDLKMKGDSIQAVHKTDTAKSFYIKLDRVSDNVKRNNESNVNFFTSKTNNANEIPIHEDFCDGYNSSDFEFISESEAELGGIIVNEFKKMNYSVQEDYNKKSVCTKQGFSNVEKKINNDLRLKIEPSKAESLSNETNRSTDTGKQHSTGTSVYITKSNYNKWYKFRTRLNRALLNTDYRQNHVILQGNDYIELFRNREITEQSIFDGNKSIHNSGMYLEYEGMGFDERIMYDLGHGSEDEYKEAAETVKKILCLYPQENRAKRTRRK